MNIFEGALPQYTAMATFGDFPRPMVGDYVIIEMCDREIPFICGVVEQHVNENTFLQNCVVGEYANKAKTHVIYNSSYDDSIVLISWEGVDRFQVVNRDTYEELMRYKDLTRTMSLNSKEQLAQYKKLGIRLHFFE